MVRIVTVCLVMLLGFFTLAACGRSPSENWSGSSQPSARTAGSAEEPRWLVEALEKLRRLPCPAGADPGVFASLKQRLGKGLRERAAGKRISEFVAEDT